MIELPLLSFRIFKRDVVEPQPFSGSNLLQNESENTYIDVFSTEFKISAVF